MSIIYIIILFFVCLVLYKSGFKFFLLWLAICAGVFYFLNAAAGIWGLFIYGFMWSHDGLSSKSSDTKSFDRSDYSSVSAYSGGSSNSNTHRGTSYNSGDVIHYSNGNSSVRYGDITYFNGGVRSVQSRNVTYYFDGNNQELGRSVDNSNGVHTYFDVNNREIGHSYTSGRITDFIGNALKYKDKNLLLQMCKGIAIIQQMGLRIQKTSSRYG